MASNTRKTTTQFIKEAEIIFPNYDYSKVEYKNSDIKIIVSCRKHGEFLSRPADLLRNHGCPKCGKENMAKKRRKPRYEFIEEAVKKWPDYDYSLSIYKRYHSKIKIICKKHGIFGMTPANLLSGHGCPHCVGKAKKTTVSFKKEAKLVNSDYDYNEVKYINNSTKVKIICKKHGSFLIQPVELLRGKGCPSCKKSKLEHKTEKIIKELNIKYIPQKKFEKCKNINHLPFDFFIPDYNLLIECQGSQHYYPHSIFGGHDGYIKRKIRDLIKKNFALNNNFIFLEIPYWKTESQIKSLIHVKVC